MGREARQTGAEPTRVGDDEPRHQQRRAERERCDERSEAPVQPGHQRGHVEFLHAAETLIQRVRREETQPGDEGEDGGDAGGGPSPIRRCRRRKQRLEILPEAGYRPVPAAWLFGHRGGYIRLMDNAAVGKPCHECGTKIQKIQYLGGACYFCPKCQV